MVLFALFACLLVRCGAVESTPQPPASGSAGSGGASGTESFIISREGDLWHFTLAAQKWDRLTEKSPVESSTQPRVSPDGARIAFSLRPPLPQPSADQPFVVPTNVIALMPTGGGAPTTLYAPPKGKVDNEQAFDSVDNPAWSPDGKTIYAGYQTLRFDDKGVFLRTANDIIAITVADGASRVLIKDAAFPAPSPDGKSIVFIRVDADLHPKLILFDLASSSERVLVDDPTLAAMEAPVWAADSKTIYLAVSPTQVSSLPAPLRWIAAEAAEAHGLGWRIWSVGAESGRGREVNKQLFEDPRIVVGQQALFLWTFSGLWRIDLGNTAADPALLFEPGDVGGISGTP